MTLPRTGSHNGLMVSLILCNLIIEGSLFQNKQNIQLCLITRSNSNLFIRHVLTPFNKHFASHKHKPFLCSVATLLMCSCQADFPQTDESSGKLQCIMSSYVTQRHSASRRRVALSIIILSFPSNHTLFY